MIGYLIIYSAGVPLYYLGLWVVRQWFGDCATRTAATHEPNPQAVSALRVGISYRGSAL